MTATQFKEQIKALVELQQILEEETNCLKNKDFSSLNEVLFNKQKKLQDISSRDSDIASTTTLSDIENDEELFGLKRQADKAFKDCQKINEINGQLVQLSMKSNKHLMQLITQATGKNTVTYDQKGILTSGSVLGKNIQA
ncbi:MAG: flagellar protein FlgN [Psychromonas sp.]|nr:flagellar protein FlgN [Psychromonas sp.]